MRRWKFKGDRVLSRSLIYKEWRCEPTFIWVQYAPSNHTLFLNHFTWVHLPTKSSSWCPIYPTSRTFYLGLSAYNCSSTFPPPAQEVVVASLIIMVIQNPPHYLIMPNLYLTFPWRPTQLFQSTRTFFPTGIGDPL